jgi:hypothetical protein
MKKLKTNAAGWRKTMGNSSNIETSKLNYGYSGKKDIKCNSRNLTIDKSNYNFAGQHLNKNWGNDPKTFSHHNNCGKSTTDNSYMNNHHFWELSKEQLNSKHNQYQNRHEN